MSPRERTTRELKAPRAADVHRHQNVVIRHFPSEDIPRVWKGTDDRRRVQQREGNVQGVLEDGQELEVLSEVTETKVEMEIRGQETLLLHILEAILGTGVVPGQAGWQANDPIFIQVNFFSGFIGGLLFRYLVNYSKINYLMFKKLPGTSVVY